MNCLPIVGRELRVAARKRSTFWVRVGAALACLFIGTGFLVIASWQRTGAAEIGRALFYTLIWLSLAAALSGGLFLTSDCLSEEKREGTLGLLFLTDLRGFDVATGKLLVTSLRGFYGLLAVLPIIAVTEMIGGVSAENYWKSSLALINALCVSLAAGMLISTVSRDSQKALAGTFLVVLLLALGGPIVDGLIADATKRGFQPVWSLSSPGYVLVAAGAWGRSPYWEALLTTQLICWAMFAGACLLVPRTWQEGRRADAGSARGIWYVWRFGGRRRRTARRHRLLERAPVAWLAGRERWQSLALWLGALLAMAGFVIALKKMEPDGWIIWNYAGGLFILVLYLGAASQACHFLVETRRNGFIELLLATPIHENQIVKGQWRALVRLFGLPVLLLLGVHAGAAVLSSLSFQRVAKQVATATATATPAPASTNASGTVTFTMNVNQRSTVNTTVTVSGLTNSTTTTNALAAPAPARLPSTRQSVALTIVSATAATVSTLANLLAICWFGIWMGMTSRTTNLATLKTLLFVQVIPWFFIAFTATFLIGMLVGKLVSGGQPATWLVWWPMLSAVTSACLALAKDIGFILWSRGKLYYSFREQATRTNAQPRFATPPPLPPGLKAR
jgi:hypothetical protein